MVFIVMDMTYVGFQSSFLCHLQNSEALSKQIVSEMLTKNSVLFYVNLMKSCRAANRNRTVLTNDNYRFRIYLAMVNGKREYTKLVISENLKLNTESPVSLGSVTDFIPKINTEGSRRLAVLLEYMNAKEKHIRNFIDLYMSFGFDVLQVHLKPWQLMWPTTGSQIVAKHVADFLAKNECFSPLVIHGFSVGAYLWGEIVVHFSKNLALYQPVIDKIKCKIFDSAVDVNEIPDGFPRAVFPKNPILRSTFEKYLRCHMRFFYEESTKHYYAARKEFSGGVVKCPTLMITSTTDPLSTVATNEAVRRELASLNLKCFLKVFDGSPHVAHFKKHRESYVQEIEGIFSKVGIIDQQRLNSKL